MGWKEIATEMFYKYRSESKKYAPGNGMQVMELCLINAGKASALYELLERYDAAPPIME